MDFVHDALADRRPFRVLTVIDQRSRQSPMFMMGTSVSGPCVGEALYMALLAGPVPSSIAVPHRTDFCSRALEDWEYRHGVRLDFTPSGKPTDNPFSESFNGQLRDASLNVTQLSSIDNTQASIEAWRIDYNHHRHTAHLGITRRPRSYGGTSRRHRSRPPPPAWIFRTMGQRQSPREVGF